MVVAEKRERILSRLIEEEMRESFLDYSMSVIVQRALPDVRDGLKPVHRRILYAMYELGLTPGRPFKKSATVVGEVLGKFHPHGDAAVYEALVRMVQDFSLRYPLVEGQGNFGSIDGDAAAAYRYTEVRLASPAMELLVDIDKDTVAWLPNFDNRLEEPAVLPGRLPNLLVNGSAGIAVGMSTNIPPHNLREVAEALRVLVNDPQCTVSDLMRVMPGPDFPTGGFLVGREGIREMYETGKGRLSVRARVVKEVLRAGREQLVITELPYGVSKLKVIEQIADLARRGKLEEVSELRDESDREGMRLVLELKRGADARRLLRTLLKRTSLQTTFGAHLLALDHGQPREFTLKALLEQYRDHRLEMIRRRSRHDLVKAEAERHITEGLLAALDRIEEVVDLIRRSRNRQEASKGLQAGLGLSEAQAEAILDMRLARLTTLERAGLEERLQELVHRIRSLQGILGSEERQAGILLEELDEVVRRFADERRSAILDEAEEEASLESSVADEDVVVTVSHEGFAKRIPMHLYRRRLSGGKALAAMDRYEGDYLERLFVVRTQGWMLVFTRRGQVYFLSVLDVPEGSRLSRGQSLYSLVGADRRDPIVSVLAVGDLSEERYLLFISRAGVVKRTALAEYSNPRAGGIIGTGLKGGDEVHDVVLSGGDADILMISRQGRAIRFREAEVPVLGRTAQGVKGVALKEGDKLAAVSLVRGETQVLAVAEDGTAMRMPVEQFPLQKRGGMGTLLSGGDAKGKGWAAALEVADGEEVMVVSAAGRVAPLNVDEVPLEDRRSRGKKVVSFPAGDRVAEVTRLWEGRGGGLGARQGGGARGAEEEGGEGASEPVPEQFDLLV